MPAHIQFTCRTLLLLVALFAAALGYWQWHRAQFAQQWTALDYVNGRRVSWTKDDHLANVYHDYGAIRLSCTVQENPSAVVRFLYPDDDVLIIKSLEIIDVHGQGAVSRFLEKARLFSGLAELSIWCDKMSDDDLERLTRVRTLATIQLHSNQVTGSGLRSLASLSHLTSLSLNSHAATCDGIQQIRNLTNITLLSLETSRNEDCVLCNASWLSDLRSLSYLALEGDVDDATLRTLGELPNLSSVHIGPVRREKITDAGIREIVKCPSLRRLSFRGAVSDAVIPALVECRSLKSLDISRCDITPEGLESLKSQRPDITVNVYALQLLSPDQ